MRNLSEVNPSHDQTNSGAMMPPKKRRPTRSQSQSEEKESKVTTTWSTAPTNGTGAKLEPSEEGGDKLDDSKTEEAPDGGEQVPNSQDVKPKVDCTPPNSPPSKENISHLCFVIHGMGKPAIDHLPENCICISLSESTP
jgi:hypothetical protein